MPIVENNLDAIGRTPLDAGECDLTTALFDGLRETTEATGPTASAIPYPLGTE